MIGVMEFSIGAYSRAKKRADSGKPSALWDIWSLAKRYPNNRS